MEDVQGTDQAGAGSEEDPTQTGTVRNAAAAVQATATVPVSNGAPYPPPDSQATAETIRTRVADALARRDSEALGEAIGSRFTTLFHPSGGSNVESVMVKKAFEARYLPAGGPAVTLEEPPPGRSPISDTLKGAFDPRLTVHDVLFSRGWGADGQGEAQLVLLRDRDGNVYLANWHVDTSLGQAQVYSYRPWDSAHEAGWQPGMSLGRVTATRSRATAS